MAKAQSLQHLRHLIFCLKLSEDEVSKTDDGTLSEPESVNIQPSHKVKHPIAVNSKGHHFHLGDGRKILDACGGAGVASIGHGNRRVLWGMFCQSLRLTYVPWAFFDNEPTIKLWTWLAESTQGKLPIACLIPSGSEAIEGAVKLAREYFLWKGEPQRVNFIAREEFYHGTTLGSLSMSGHLTRRAPFEEILLPNVYRVSACNSYRQKLEEESEANFIAMKVKEIEQAFNDAGSGTVVAFIAEHLVGAVMGCVPSPHGYFQAVREVCDKHGALLILDEVMCGMGRTRTLHAWEQEGVVPDIQTIGKGSRWWLPACICCPFWRQDCVRDVAERSKLHSRPYVPEPRNGVCGGSQGSKGDRAESPSRECSGTRGRGLFWGIEFVFDKLTQEPFDSNLEVARKVHDRAINAGNPMMVYYGQGCAGNRKGDHVMNMPAYDATLKLMEDMVDRLVSAVNVTFDDI